MKISTSLVLNWHLSEACNYRCQYCYATWSKSGCRQDIIQTSERSLALLSELYRFFNPLNSDNPLTKEMQWTSVRLNLAGGEPLLHATKLLTVVSQARTIGFDVSLISNGSYLDHDLVEELAPQLTLLGISIDSLLPETNRAIGRIDRHERLLDLDYLAVILAKARKSNPDLSLKLNTVVNRHNYNEDLADVVRRFAPDKWKVLRMLPVVNDELAISDLQFAEFVSRHSPLSDILCTEDNQDMRESYLMIDPLGRFFQNSPQSIGAGYVYSQPILDVGADAAFAEMTFEPERFRARYHWITAGEEA